MSPSILRIRCPTEYFYLTPTYHSRDYRYDLAGNCGTYPGRFTETQFLCIVRASSLKSLGTLLEPLQTAIDFYVRIRINQPINDL